MAWVVRPPYSAGAGKGSAKVVAPPPWARPVGSKNAGAMAIQYTEGSQGSSSTGKLCVFFAQGTCRKGPYCDFIHDTGGELPRQNGHFNGRIGTAGVKRKICAYFVQGTCKKGDACDFAHFDDEFESESRKLQTNARSDTTVGAGGYKLKMCAYFLQGSCKKGPECTFSHGEYELRGRDAPAEQTPVGQAVPRRMCTFYLQGSCKKGDQCDFSHEAEEVVSDAAGIQSAVPEHDPRYKTILCRHFEQSHTCPRGDTCGFAHGQDELRRSDAPPWASNRSETDAPPWASNRSETLGTARADRNTKKMCDDWLQGHCRKGDACKLIHGKSTAAAEDWQRDGNAHETAGPGVKSRLCSFFIEQGFCKKGEFCGFAHGEEELGEAINVEIQGDDPRYKTQLCRHFSQSSSCPRGDACSFAHGADELRANDTPTERFDSMGVTGNDRNTKKMCDDWLQGFCRRGDTCSLIHGKLTPIGSAPAVSERQTGSDSGGHGFKRILCSFFMDQGFCKRGDSCTFAHGEHELRVNDNEASSTIGFKTKMCNFFLQGTCMKGASCNFAHGEHELPGNDLDASSDIAKAASSAAGSKGKLCIFFLQGSCKKGSACDFIHEESEQETQADLPLSDAGPADRYRTKMCSFFLQGTCKKGPACPFAHGEQELSGFPRSAEIVPEPVSAPDGVPFKTKLCWHFQQGSCPRGSTCTFAHGEHEIASLDRKDDIGPEDDSAPEPPANKFTKLCWHFQQGSCPKGDDCMFAHGAHELQPSTPPMCKYFLQGSCKKGWECDFSHGSAAAEEVAPRNDGAAASGFKTKMCMFFSSQGFCQKGSECTFAHGEHELQWPTDGVSTALSRPMCKYFLQGSCKKGADCDFSHGDDSSRFTEDMAGKGKLKARMCLFFLQGSCKKGNECDFAHDSNELDRQEAPRVVTPPIKKIAITVPPPKKAKVEQAENDGDPDDWEALEDEDGEVYYHHMPSGRTQWDPPKLPPILKAGAEDAVSKEDSVKRTA